MPEDGRTKRKPEPRSTKTMWKHLHLRRLERPLAQTAAGRGMGMSFHTVGRIWVSETKSVEDCKPREVLDF